MPHISKLDWSRHTHIGLDLDETLAATMLGFLTYAHSEGDLLWVKSLEDIVSHDEKGFGDGITRERILSLWEEYGQSSMDPLSVPMISGALEVIDRFQKREKNISIITARSDKESWKKSRTYAWISHYLPSISLDSIHFVNHYSTETRPKSAPCRELGITLMIEDALENTIELCENGITTLLLEKPWNRHQTFDHPLLYRVKDWNEILESLR